MTLDLSDLRTNSLNGKVSNGNMYNCVAISDGDSDREGACCTKLEARDFYHDPLDSLHGIQARQLPELPPNPDYSTGGCLGTSGVLLRKQSVHHIEAVSLTEMVM